jgi:mannose-1-phosphate guanylyltransferase
MTDLSRWPALVLTAGLATRMRPLSSVRAKAALPVAGTPLVVRILRWLHAAGVKRAVLNLHHRPETITRVVGDGACAGLEVRYSWEPEILGSAGGVARAIPLLAADRFLIVNGDTFADVDLGRLAGEHVSSGAQVTMAVVDSDLSKYNALLLDAGGALVGHAARGESPPPDAGRPVHFIGIQAACASAFAGVSPSRASETVLELYPRLTASAPGSVRAHHVTTPFYDIGTPADYLATVRRVAAAEGAAIDRGVDCRIAADAVVEQSVLWDRVGVGAGALVTECVVADDVAIPPGARYHRSAIVRGPSGLDVVSL